jgi:3-oxoacyl-[acyl-carrier protein] reductase
MDLGLQNQVALVTAASRGLGAAVARRFAQEGAQVIICGRDEARLSATVANIEADTGAEVVAIQADVTVPADVEALIAEVVESFGRIDHLIVNAGGPPAGTFASLQPEDWDKAAHLTLMSAVRLCYAAVPHMKRQGSGSIVFITSVAVKQPLNNLILSNSIRMALVGLMKSLSQELGPAGIRVNAVAPGWTMTERVTELLAARAQANGTTPEAEASKIVGELPLGRMAQPEEFAKATVFLASPAASYITGVTLPVDGGAIKASL